MFRQVEGRVAYADGRPRKRPQSCCSARGRVDRRCRNSGQGYLSPENSVVVLSEHCIIDPNGKTKKLTCSCSRELAPARKCRSCKCAKRGRPCVAIACGCKGLCGRAAGGPVTLAPEASPPDSQSTPTQDISARAPEGGMMINMKMAGASNQ